MKRSAKFSLLATFGVAALVLSGCAASTTEEATSAAPEGTAAEAPMFAAGSTMARLADAGKVTIGTKFDQPLFGLVAPNGIPVGFDVEIAIMIAAELGISEENINWVETVSANREPFIESGQVDFVVATYTINDKRKEIISFAGPYFLAGQSILVLADNDTIKSEADLVGQPVCSVTGSTPAEKLAELGAVTFLTDTYTNCLEPLRTGAVVAVSTDNVILAGLAFQNEGQFKIAGDAFTDEPYGIGVLKDDTEFRMWINDLLEASYQDGRYQTAWDTTAGVLLPFRAAPMPDRY